MESQLGGYEKYLYPNREVPVPLPEDFYKAWLAGDTTRPPSQGKLSNFLFNLHAFYLSYSVS